MPYNRDHQKTIDNMSEPEHSTAGDELLKLLDLDGVPAWLAEAIVEAVWCDDPKFLARQVDRHYPEWKNV